MDDSFHGKGVCAFVRHAVDSTLVFAAPYQRQIRTKTCLRRPFFAG
jgi:hypothetical protein